MYERLRRMGNTRAMYACPKYFKYYTIDEAGEGLTIPRGMVTRLTNFLDTIGEKCEVKYDLISRPSTMLTRSALNLRDYQIPIVEEVIKHHTGMIVMATGSGKSVVGAEIASRLKKTACVLVPNTALMDQWASVFKQFYGVEVAKIGGGKKDIGEITISTFQSLQNNGPLHNKLASQTSILLVDECQSAISDKRRDVLNSFHPERFYGLTATPYRSKDDGQSDAVGFYFGKPLCNYESTQATPKIEIIKSGVEIPVSCIYHEMVDDMVENEERNKLIIGLAMGESLSKRKVLVLTKRVAHAKELYKPFRSWKGAFLIDSKDKNRNKLLLSLKEGEQEFTIIFGTTSLLAVGIDVPSLDILIMACDMKSDVLTVQSAGRILRLFEDKPDPKIIDIRDNKNPIFNRQGLERASIYRKKGWKIVN